MLHFHRRRLGCWNACDDYDYMTMDSIPVLTFANENELFEWIKKTLPFTQDESAYKLRIVDDWVCHWTGLGWVTIA